MLLIRGGGGSGISFFSFLSMVLEPVLLGIKVVPLFLSKLGLKLPIDFLELLSKLDDEPDVEESEDEVLLSLLFEVELLSSEVELSVEFPSAVELPSSIELSVEFPSDAELSDEVEFKESSVELPSENEVDLSFVVNTPENYGVGSAGASIVILIGMVSLLPSYLVIFAVKST